MSFLSAALVGGRPAGAPSRAVVPFRRDEPAMPRQQGAGRDREDPTPPAAGYQPGQRSQPEPVKGLIPDSVVDLTPQHRVLVPQHQQLRDLRRLAAQQYPGDGQ
jgi:hypothetical protein